MIVKNAELETVCGITSKLPENGQIEVAFAGKSNVGKSSLINGLMKVSCTYQLGTGKDADHQFLCRDRTQRDKKRSTGHGVCG